MERVTKNDYGFCSYAPRPDWCETPANTLVKWQEGGVMMTLFTCEPHGEVAVVEHPGRERVALP